MLAGSNPVRLTNKLNKRAINKQSKTKKMPLVKANESLPERPVVIGYYGEPGVKKTSIAHTADTPLLIDFDRGVARSYGRKDSVVVNDWAEVLQYEREGLYKQYKTVIIDTAKAALDDFLMMHVVKQDYKMQKNKLQAYGAIGDEFKRFLNQLRNDGVDVIIIAHAKKDEDTKKMIPDVTGQSYNLILRVSDQIGFVSTKNNKSVIEWTPSDVTVGKNTAALPEAIIPDKSDPLFKTFLSVIVNQVKAAIVAQSEEQREALAKSERIQEEIAASKSIGDLTLIIPVITVQPNYLQVQLLHVLTQKAVSLIPSFTTVDQLNGALTFFQEKPMVLTAAIQTEMKKLQDANKWKFNKDTKKFFAPEPEKPKVDEAIATHLGEGLTEFNKPAATGKEAELAFN